jgi:hypothetical protein
MRRKKSLEMLAANFLLAFDEQDQIDGQSAALVQRLFNSEHMREVLAFVVRRPAREDVTVGHARFERRRIPKRQRINRLHVVVSVDHHRAASSNVRVFRNDDRVSGCRVKGRCQPHRTQLRGEPVCARRQI